MDVISDLEAVRADRRHAGSLRGSQGEAADAAGVNQPTSARGTHTVDGVRRVVSLDAAESFELRLTAAQLKTLTLEQLAGAVGVATAWREPVSASVLTPDADVTMTRTVTPNGTVASSDLIRVDIRVTFGPQAALGCLQVRSDEDRHSLSRSRAGAPTGLAGSAPRLRPVGTPYNRVDGR